MNASRNGMLGRNDREGESRRRRAKAMVGGRREQVERERAKGRLVLLPREGSVVATGLRAQPSRANQTLSQDSTIFSSKDSDTGGLSACFSHQVEWRDYQTLQSRNPRDWPASGQTTSVGGGCGFL